MNLNCGPLLQDFLLTKGFRSSWCLLGVVMFSAHVCREKFPWLKERGGPLWTSRACVPDSSIFLCVRGDWAPRVARERGDGRAIFFYFFVFFVSKGKKMHPRRCCTVAHSSFRRKFSSILQTLGVTTPRVQHSIRPQCGPHLHGRRSIHFG